MQCPRRPERASDPLVLELPVAVSHLMYVLGIKLDSSTAAKCALPQGVIFLVLCCFLNGQHWGDGLVPKSLSFLDCKSIHTIGSQNDDIEV